MKLKLVFFIVIASIIHAMTNTVLAKSDAISQIEVDIKNTKNEVIGKATIKPNADKVDIHLVASGLTPGVHAFHIHEFGKCETPEFKSAGGHFNPTNNEHGFNNPKGFHGGDLPNLEVGQDGTVDVIVTTHAVSLKKDQPHSLLKSDGTSLIIHEKADDYVTDPAGNAGARIACGVIK